MQTIERQLRVLRSQGFESTFNTPIDISNFSRFRCRKNTPPSLPCARESSLAGFSTRSSAVFGACDTFGCAHPCYVSLVHIVFWGSVESILVILHAKVEGLALVNGLG